MEAEYLPTSHPPGSFAKLEVMRLRAQAGLPIFHPLDAGPSSGEHVGGDTRHREFVSPEQYDREERQRELRSLASKRARRLRHKNGTQAVFVNV
jgi:hypothetical protein